MAHEILTVKLCELEDQLARLSGRIHLSETAGHDRLRQEIGALSKECAEGELILQKKLQLSRAEMVATLAAAYREIEQVIQRAKEALEDPAAGRDGAEEKLLLAEYALDFAVQAARRALLLSMEAIDAQLTGRETERRPS